MDGISDGSLQPLLCVAVDFEEESIPGGMMFTLTCLQGGDSGITINLRTGPKRTGPLLWEKCKGSTPRKRQLWRVSEPVETSEPLLSQGDGCWWSLSAQGEHSCGAGALGFCCLSSRWSAGMNSRCFLVDRSSLCSLAGQEKDGAPPKITEFSKRSVKTATKANIYAGN